MGKEAGSTINSNEPDSRRRKSHNERLASDPGKKKRRHRATNRDAADTTDVADLEREG